MGSTQSTWGIQIVLVKFINVRLSTKCVKFLFAAEVLLNIIFSKKPEQKSETDKLKEKITPLHKNTNYEKMLKNIDFLKIEKDQKDQKFSVAERDIKANEIITEIPLENIIYINNPIVRNFCEALQLEEFSEDWIKSYETECLVLFNLAQIRHPHENFKHYFENNQINFADYPLLWPEEKLKLIKNTFMENTLFDMNLTIKEYTNLLQRSSYFPKYSLTDLKKAFILMNSQNFKIKIEENVYTVIIPFMDIYKHDPNTNIDWSPEVLDLSKGLVLKAVSDISKGSPLITNYGESDNANLLINYGFTLQKNNFNIETEFFNFNYLDNNYAIGLNMKNTEEIFDVLHQIKSDNFLTSLHKPRKISKIPEDKEQEKKQDIIIFQMILQNLSKYSNKKRLENLSDSIINNDDKTDKDILRALNAEEQLIEKNMKNIIEIIQILKTKGDMKSLVKENNKIYLQNRKYFDRILSQNVAVIKRKNVIVNKQKTQEIIKKSKESEKNENLRNIVITYNNKF